MSHLQFSQSSFLWEFLALSGEQGRLYCPHNTDAEVEALREKLTGHSVCGRTGTSGLMG